MDLIDFFRGRHAWTKFWRLLSQLGADSRYVKAQQDDPEVAEHLAANAQPDDESWRPSPYDWTLDRELLARLGDRLGHVAALIADLPVGVKQRHTPPGPFPRPLSELDKARKRIKDAHDTAYDDRLMGAVERAKQRWREQNPDAPPPGRRSAPAARGESQG